MQSFERLRKEDSDGSRIIAPVVMIQLDPPLKTQLEKVDRGTELLNFLSNHSKLNFR